jgi:hypothetical protein
MQETASRGRKRAGRGGKVGVACVHPLRISPENIRAWKTGIKRGPGKLAVFRHHKKGLDYGGKYYLTF